MIVVDIFSFLISFWSVSMILKLSSRWFFIVFSAFLNALSRFVPFSS